ncbi:MAG: transglycosylase SLT domain-containing protein [Prevotella sp.]|nr:transglycosylase SLT domain-containing protein [Candidatus Prevotella equi]
MYFSKIAKVVLFTAFTSVVTVNANARENGANKFDWGPLMDAITQVESEGDCRAVSGTSCGAMQIKPILVEDCNAILKKRGESKRYTLNDRFNVKKSREMFVLIMSHYNPQNNVERAIRLWNGGIRYTVKGTQQYYNKVMRLYK